MLDEEVAKKEIDGLSFWVYHCGSFSFWHYAKYTQLIFCSRDESIELINVVSLYFDLVEKVKIDILWLRFTADLNLFIFYPTHLKLSYNYNLQIPYFSCPIIKEHFFPTNHSFYATYVEYIQIIAQIIIGFFELKSENE